MKMCLTLSPLLGKFKQFVFIVMPSSPSATVGPFFFVTQYPIRNGVKLNNKRIKKATFLLCAPGPPLWGLALATE